ncbi:hypothetical protein SLS62_009062 [Diatrype stigma]|uniref:Protein kinase domain-containing protein n=1 Tax=Diatrype stigma TaxID=117547 RepID=A0AAN9URU6_9PEZI
MLQHLKKLGPGHPNIISIHDSFNITGPNGEHTCLVLPVLGPTLYKYEVDTNVTFELPDLLSVPLEQIYQMLGPIKKERPRFFGRLQSAHPPRRIVEAADFSGLDLSALSKIRLIDFGESFFRNKPPSSLGTAIDFFPRSSALAIRLR